MLEVAEVRPETVVARLAGRQHGLVTTAQLVAAGWSKDQIAWRARAGWLHSVRRGVYLVGPLETPYTDVMAAVLAYGAHAVASHHPAAVLWDWRQPGEGAVHVTLASRAHSRPGITVHRVTLHPSDITRRRGIPVTSAARTILDLAATEGSAEVERTLNEAYLQRRVSPRSLNEQFSRYPRHRGTTRLRHLIEDEPSFTRSEAERLALELIRRAGLPAPETNQRVEGFEVDLVWRDHNLIVEIDGWAFHSMRSSFEQDRRRDQLLITAGWRVVRVTWRQLTERPEAIAVMLATALAA